MLRPVRAASVQAWTWSVAAAAPSQSNSQAAEAAQICDGKTPPACQFFRLRPARLARRTSGTARTSRTWEARLAREGVAGLRVLQFERNHDRFNPPDWYPATAVAMTATHDTATIEGWWRGADIEARAALAQLPPGRTGEQCEDDRAAEREMAWRAFVEAHVADGPRPPADEAGAAVEAATRFVAQTQAALAILPLEDALALREQPNLPGTTTEYPNWRRRYPGEAATMLDEADVSARLANLDARRSVA